MVHVDHADDRSTSIVGIIMGSQSDWPTMKNAALILDQLGIPYEKRIISAHRTPKRMANYAENARERGLKIIIAGAGGAAAYGGRPCISRKWSEARRRHSPLQTLQHQQPQSVQYHHP